MTLFAEPSTLSAPVTAGGHDQYQHHGQPEGQGRIAVDAKTGQILYDKIAISLAVASMAKLLSIYLVLDAVHNDQLKWDQKITVNKATARVAQDTSLSNAVARGSQVRSRRCTRLRFTHPAGPSKPWTAVARSPQPSW